MRENIKPDIKALIRIIAFAIAKCYSGAQDLVEWAYEKGIEDSSPAALIDKYLTTDSPVHSQTKKDFIKRFLEDKEPFPVEASKAIILHMPYEEFLKTPYWKAISQYIKQRDFNRCTRCGNQRRLQVHHLNYTHHGDELHHLEDLTCLCKSCHNKVHEEKRLHKTVPND